MRSKFTLLSTGAIGQPALSYPPIIRAYLIDLHTHQHECWLGTLQDGVIQLSDWGQVAAEEWIRVSSHRKDFRLDAWGIQPSSIRGIVLLAQSSSLVEAAVTDRSQPGEKPWALSSFVASFKAAAAKRVNLLRNQPGLPVWQRGYHEQLIPDTETLDQLRQSLQQ